MPTTEYAKQPRFGYGVYHDSAGATWAIRLSAQTLGQPDGGWSGSAIGLDVFSGRPRAVIGTDMTNGTQRILVVGTESCDLWTGAQATFDLPVAGLVDDVTFTVTGFRPEKRAKKGHDVYNPPQDSVTVP